MKERLQRIKILQTIVQIVLLWLMTSHSESLFAQNDIQLSQQMFSRINYNPAATGLSEDLQFYLLARQQWVGFKDAPQTIVLNGNTFVPWTRSGWGFSIIGDMLGHEQSVNPKLTYAFHIPFMRSRSSLSLGLSAGVLYKRIDGAKLVYENPNDPNRLYSMVSKVKPDFDFGLEYNSKYVNVGASVTHIGNRLNNNESNESSPHFYAYARGMYRLTRNWQVSPAVSWHNSKNVNQLEANALFFYKRIGWVGASYRANEAIIGLLGVYITPNLMLGYSYDYTASTLTPSSQGSHEIMLSLRIAQPQKARKASRMRECRHEWW